MISLAAAPLPTPAQGAVKLAFPLTPAGTAALAHHIIEGLTDNLNYPDFDPVRVSLTVQYDALSAAIDYAAAAEATAKAARLARDLEVLNMENALRNTALACEAVDRREEALISVGWTVRRSPGGPKPLPAPARLALKNLPYEGQVQARWASVTNRNYYEIKAYTGGENPDPNVWEELPIFPEGRVTKVFSELPVGSYLSVRVRTVGARGPSPWTEAVTIRVS